MICEPIRLGEGTDYPLNGLLTLPDDLTKPVPAVVMIHGSGPSNMDEKVGKLTPFKDLAEGLARRGVATARMRSLPSAANGSTGGYRQKYKYRNYKYRYYDDVEKK